MNEQTKNGYDASIHEARLMVGGIPLFKINRIFCSVDMWYLNSKYEIVNLRVVS